MKFSHQRNYVSQSMKRIFVYILLLTFNLSRAQLVSICDINDPKQNLYQENQLVQISGFVSGVFNQENQLNAVFISAKHCNNKDISIGMCIVDKKTSLDVDIGNQVVVQGNLHLVNGKYRLINPKLMDKRETEMLLLPKQLDTKSFQNPSQFEDMYVLLKGEWFVSDTYHTSRFGQVVLSATKNEMQISESKSWYKSKNEDRVEMNSKTHSYLVLDDGSLQINPLPIPFLSTDDSTLERGTILTDPVGILYRHKGKYMLEPIGNLNWTFDKTDGKIHEKEGIRFASYNLHNWFSSLDDGKNRTKGADTPEEQIRQLSKLTEALVKMDADLYGLVELENNEEAADMLLKSLNDKVGEEKYKLIYNQKIGKNKTKVGLIYNVTILTPIGTSIIDNNPIHIRPPLAQRFKKTSGNDEIWFIMSHFKSKKCGRAEGLEANQNDGQSCWNHRRTEQAKRLVAFQDSLVSLNPGHLILAGDFNAYSFEDPIQQLESSGFKRAIQGDYTYVYKGKAGMLDYILVSPSIEINQAFVWHINADQPRFRDYNMEFNGAEYFKADEFRSSDHDPVIMDINWK